MSRALVAVKTADLPRRRMHYGLMALFLLAVTALVAARLSSPELLSSAWQPRSTETPYGILMICLSTLSALVPLNGRSAFGFRFLLAVGVAIMTGALGYQFLPVGGYDLYAKVGLYGYALLAGLGYLIAGSLTRPSADNSAVWWGFVWAGAIALVVLSFVFLGARPGVVSRGPGIGAWNGSVTCRVLLSTDWRASAPTGDLMLGGRQAENNVVDLGPGPGGRPPAHLAAANAGVELTLGEQMAWRLRVPLGNTEQSLLWAKWTDSGGIVLAVTRLDWRNAAMRGSFPGYPVITVYQVGP